METIKASKSVEFDVIYADGTRRHVKEGLLFEVENEKMFFHNGTDRAAVLIATAEAAAEVVGGLGLTEREGALLLYNIHKRIMGRKDEAADFKINIGG